MMTVFRQITIYERLKAEIKRLVENPDEPCEIEGVLISNGNGQNDSFQRGIFGIDIFYVPAMDSRLDIDRPKLGTSARIHGYACPHESCSRFQAITNGSSVCAYCGSEMRPASASVAVFKWEDEQDKPPFAPLTYGAVFDDDDGFDG